MMFPPAAAMMTRRKFAGMRPDMVAMVASAINRLPYYRRSSSKPQNLPDFGRPPMGEVESSRLGSRKYERVGPKFLDLGQLALSDLSRALRRSSLYARVWRASCSALFALQYC